MLQIERILHPTDFSPSAEAAFDQVQHLARQHEAELHLLHVAPTFGEDPARGAFKAATDEDVFYRKLRDEADEHMQQLIEARTEDDGVPIKRVHSRGAAPGEVILDYATAEDIDLIVMGTHGRRGLGRFMAGSVAEEVMRRAPCDVLTVRERQPEKESLQRILVPIDFSKHAEALLQKARHVAAAFEAQVDLLHVIEPLPSLVSSSGLMSIHDLVPDIREKSRRELERLLRNVEGPDVPAEMHLAEGHAAAEIVRFAEEEDIDLVMMASHGLSGLERFFIGSVTERVMRTAPCPVWSLRVLEAPPVPEAEEAAESAAE